MIGRRSAVGLSLLCALFFCAFAAQGASAAGTTAFTCVPNGGNKDFSDAHCDTEVPAGTGSFGHVLIPAGLTYVHLNNAKTKNATTEAEPFVLKGKAFLVKNQITCTTANGEAKLKNEEVAGEMVVKGEEKQAGEPESMGTVSYTGCTVQEPANCTVKEPIVAGGSSITRTNLGAGKNEMGVEFKPRAGKAFTEITFEGASCGIKGLTAKVEGTAIATGGRGSTNAVTSSGATLVFTEAMTKETLKFGGEPASVSGKLTVSMANESTGATENPITLTTTAN
jgi:hypothetical protein